MNSLFITFLIPLLAGFSTLLGYLPTYIPDKYHQEVIGASLAFSSGIMLALSLFSLIPEAFSHIVMLSFFPKITIFSIFFFLGVLFSLSLDQWFSNKNDSSKLYQLGIISMITLMIHNIPEGIVTFLTTTSDLKLGISLAIAIAIHNIPEGISIAIPIYYASKSRGKALFYTALSGFSEFLGALLAYFFLKRYLSSFLLMAMVDMTAGIMIHLSLTEILPTSFQYINSKKVLINLLLGILIMIVCIFIFRI